MKILGIIPARGGSKGIPEKNIKFLDGRPLLQYTAEVAARSTRLDTVILSSEDAKIAVVAQQIGLHVPFVRPEALATDTAPTLGVVLHALDFYESIGQHFDAVCLLQATSPFRTVGFLDAAIDRFVSSGADSLISVLPVPHEYNPHWVFEIDGQDRLRIATGESQIIPRRQELPPAYHRDGSIYITKSAVLRSGSLYGGHIAYAVSDPAFYVNIDTLADWEKAERLAVLWNQSHEK